MNVEAYAKINLSLDVLKKREDGYHEVSMVMQSLALHDSIEIVRTDDGSVRAELVDCKEGFSDIPTGEDNLVCRAAMLMKDRFAIEDGFVLRLTKRIPHSAGLGGGSSDAAAVIRGLNDMYDLGLGPGQLMRLGKEIGADVPFCLMGGTALAEGIGERLTRLKAAPACRVLLVKPRRAVSTREIYERVDSSDRHFVPSPDTKKVCEAIENGSLKSLAGSMGNILESVTAKLMPEIGEIEKRMLERGALGAMMSGSGPTVFGLYSDPGLLEEAALYFSDEAVMRELDTETPIRTEFYRIRGL